MRDGRGSDQFFKKDAAVAVFGQRPEGHIQFFPEVRLVAAVVGVKILFVDHQADRRAGEQAPDPLREFLFGKEIA